MRKLLEVPAEFAETALGSELEESIVFADDLEGDEEPGKEHRAGHRGHGQQRGRERVLPLQRAQGSV
jgi:hypothetical protein